jgi:hypothetical protein
VNLPFERLKAERRPALMEMECVHLLLRKWTKQGGTTEARPFRPLWMKGSVFFPKTEGGMSE